MITCPACDHEDPERARFRFTCDAPLVTGAWNALLEGAATP